jgi:surfactin synthase thioesterase subunit
VRLVLLHHAGGSALLYRGWERWLPASWQVLAIDFPGRGRWRDRPPVRTIGALAEQVLDEALAGLDGPLALFGHSMGAAVAAEVTNRLAYGAGPMPCWVGVSGWDARRPDSFDGMPDDELRDKLVALGGTPPGLLTDQEQWRRLAPLLSADLAVVASGDPGAGGGWLTAPLSLFGGRFDAVAGAARLTELAGRARRLVGLHLHPGGHFYLSERPGAVARQIAADIAAAGQQTSWQRRIS